MRLRALQESGERVEVVNRLGLGEARSSLDLGAELRELDLLIQAAGPAVAMAKRVGAPIALPARSARSGPFAMRSRLRTSTPETRLACG